jgi:hypothetical protein
MKQFLIFISVFLGLVLISCEKVEVEMEKEKEEVDYGVCGFGCGISPDFCLNTSYENPEQADAGIEVLIIKPLVTSEECNCIISGEVKYLKDGKTIALVSYGNGACDDIAEKVLCVDGNCDNSDAVKCFFTLKCQLSD